MANVDLTRFIIPVELDNTDKNHKMGDESFKTKDLVFLDSSDEINDLSDQERITSLTDYAIANGACQWLEGVTRKGKKGTAVYWLRSASSSGFEADFVQGDGALKTGRMKPQLGICPALHLNLSSIISARSESRDFGKIDQVKDENGDVIYHTIEFGEYPKTKAANSNALENLFNNHKMSATGKKYVGHIDLDSGDESFIENLEYEYCGQKYVRVENTRYEQSAMSPFDIQQVSGDGYVWIKVEPIKWIIRNWDEMPASINPRGNGKATYIDVRTEEAIMGGIPFYPDPDRRGRVDSREAYNISFWQNSTIRGFLNGINVCDIKTNGNTRYTAPRGGDFSAHGFLQEAFNLEMERTLTSTQENGVEMEPQNGVEMEPQIRRSRLDKLNPDKTPAYARRRMTDTETIKSWIDAGQSVLLRGPSGIGKTDRLKKLYPDLIYIKLTNNMFPEKVVGSMNLQTGQSIPPDFAKQALLACATDDERKLIQENIQNLYELADTIYERSKTAQGKVVIMLDELLNVKPAVQSLVYTLVLNRLVETGKGLKLPANTVVVATGNQKKYSTAAEDLAEPLEKRFDHILDMEPKVGEWIYEFAIPAKIHPSVIGYIFSKYQENRRSEEISDMGYFYEEPEVGESHLDRNGCRGRTNDPRGWESISRTLYAFEEDLKNGKFVGKDVEALLRISIGSKLREEWAEEFFDFYNHPTLTVDEIVEKRYSQADLPRDINEKFATMAGLLNASTEQVGVCREFIRKYCDPEYLSVYDMYWAGNDEERMEKITELQEIQAMQPEDEGGLVR